MSFLLFSQTWVTVIINEVSKNSQNVETIVKNAVNTSNFGNWQYISKKIHPLLHERVNIFSSDSRDALQKL